MSIENPTSEKSAFEIKKEKYEELCEGAPDCLYVLGQGAVENPKSKKMPLKSAPYTTLHTDGFMLAGKARVIATAELADYFPKAKIVTCSKITLKFNTGETKNVSLSSIMSQELQHYGISQENIILQEDSYSLFTDFIELIKLTVKNHWDHVAVLTNEYQLPRCQAMFEKMDTLKDPNGESEKLDFKQALEEFKKMGASVKFVSAEDVLPLKSDHYQALLAEVKKGEAWQAITARENIGAEQIKNDMYWKNLPSHFVKPEDFEQKE